MLCAKKCQGITGLQLKIGIVNTNTSTFMVVITDVWCIWCTGVW